MTYIKLFTLLIAISLSIPAFAQNTPTPNATTFDTEVAQGKASYQAGDYQSAVKSFKTAYEARPTANLLYNIARCYDSLGDLDQAETYYNQFIKAPGITQDARADAVGRLKTVRDIQALKTNELKEQNEVKKTTVASSGPSPVAYALLGLGVAAVGAGVVTGLISQSKFDDIEQLGYPDTVAPANVDEVTDARDSGQSLQIASIALLASGALVTLGGVLTWVLSGTDETAETTLNLSPALTTNAAHVSVSATW